MRGNSIRKLPMLLAILSLLLLAVSLLAGGQTQAAPAADKGGPGPSAASPNDVTIPGTPLEVIVRDSSSYGVYRNGVQQFFGGNAEGAYLWVNGVVWGPEFVPAGNPVNQYSPVSNTLSGTGTAADPWIATTVVNVGNTGLQLTQRVIYINGNEFIRNDFSLCNTGGTAYTNLHLFHAADLYTGGIDLGYGYYDPASGAIGGYNAARDLYQIFIPITAANNYEEDFYATIWDDIGSTSGPGGGFRDFYRPNDYIDNGAGLEWIFSLTAGACTTISDYLSFSSTPVIPSQTPGGATPTPSAPQRANLCVSLRQDPDGAVPPGGVFTYTIQVLNQGPGTANDTGVRIPLDPNVEVLDFRSNSQSIFVDYVGDDAVSVLFHTMEKGSSAQAWVIARVRPTGAAGARITSRAMAYWGDTRVHATKWSNSVTISVGPLSDTGKHGLLQPLIVAPNGPVDAGTPVIIGGDFFGEEEPISFWVNLPDNDVAAIEDTGRSDQDGIMIVGLDTTDAPPGTYSLVAHGLCTDVEGMGVFTIR